MAESFNKTYKGKPFIVDLYVWLHKLYASIILHFEILKGQIFLFFPLFVHFPLLLLHCCSIRDSPAFSSWNLGGLDSFKPVGTASISFKTFELKNVVECDYQKMMALYLTSLQGI